MAMRCRIRPDTAGPSSMMWPWPIGLRTRLAAFRRDDLTVALGARSVVQATLMRVRIGTSIPHDGGPWRTSALALEAFHG